MKLKYDVSNSRSGELVFTSFSHSDKYGKSVWNVVCSCGTQKKVRADRIGIIQSCGCKTKSIVHNKLYKGSGGLSGSAWCRIRNNASARKISFGLTIDEANKLFTGKCALSGVTIQLGKDASLDRINSKIGYEVGNVQWVHKTINLMKNQLDESVFIEWTRKVANHKLCAA